MGFCAGRFRKAGLAVFFFAAFLIAGFLAGFFLPAVFAVTFFAGALLEPDFRAADFRATAFRTADFRVPFAAGFFLRAVTLRTIFFVIDLFFATFFLDFAIRFSVF
ncbi:MAG TPA: hypothetical protein VK663_14470 [Burkholderiales bacterium]|nr:hypothetical protein [Burkholderiales bacterium]